MRLRARAVRWRGAPSLDYGERSHACSLQRRELGQLVATSNTRLCYWRRVLAAEIAPHQLGGETRLVEVVEGIASASS